MASKIVVIGTGFSGVWSALAAQRLIDLHGEQNAVQVTVVAPEPALVVRPRLYEADPAGMKQDLTSLFAEANIKFVRGTVEIINAKKQQLDVRGPEGTMSIVNYDRLILAAGSNVIRPRMVSGVEQHAFDVDSIYSAAKLEEHLHRLSSLPPSPARDTVVVCGAGFTGIELATELPKRVPNVRVVLVESADAVGAALGPGPRPQITAALDKLGVDVKVGSAVASIDASGATLGSGERIGAMTVVWTAGVRATPLTQQIDGTKDKLNRLVVDEHLRVPSTPNIFATGDTACALADPTGQTALMSCQHALVLGRVSGHNAAADLLRIPCYPYSQVQYVCCLDLGACGAVVSSEYDRSKIRLTGEEAKRLKIYINQKLIYVPKKAEEALSQATPDTPGSHDLLDTMLAQIQVA